MDVNNYSHCNSASTSCPIATFMDMDHVILFEIERNWFNEVFYTVSDVRNGIFETFETYEEAAKFYNSIVPGTETIPLF